jgi:hypothetical protein
MELWRFKMRENVEDRFWGKVAVSTEHFYNGIPCWEWQACSDIDGYGIFRLNNKNEKSHRFSFTLKYGEIINGLFVCHHCDNPSCVNPDHLFLGTHQDNVDDMVSKGRNLTGDKHWAKTNPEKLAKGERSASVKYPGLRKGENNGCAKLSYEIADEIRNLYATNNYFMRDFAEKHNVSISTINSILKNRTWVR